METFVRINPFSSVQHHICSIRLSINGYMVKDFKLTHQDNSMFSPLQYPKHCFLRAIKVNVNTLFTDSGHYRSLLNSMDTQTLSHTNVKLHVPSIYVLLRGRVYILSTEPKTHNNRAMQSHLTAVISRIYHHRRAPGVHSWPFIISNLYERYPKCKWGFRIYTICGWYWSI